MQGMLFTEMHNDSSGISVKIKEILVSKKTKFQKLDIFDTEFYGKMLTLDDLVMTTEKDEFVYHEMLTHIALFSHKLPENILIIGGGDGGTAREILKHKTIKNIDMVEIDEDVVIESKKYLPTIAVELDNPKLNIMIQDGVEFVKGKSNIYDIIFIDSTDPISVGEGLFTTDFYKDCFNALKSNGILVNQSETPFHKPQWVSAINNKLKNVFPIVKVYKAEVPTYPSGIWLFEFCSKETDPYSDFNFQRYKDYNFKLKYYNDEIHKGAFSLPNYVKELLA